MFKRASARREEQFRFWERLITPLQVDIAVNQLVLQALISVLARSGERGARILDDLEKFSKEQAQTLTGDPSLSEEERQLLQERQQMTIECLSKYFDIVRKQIGLEPIAPERKKA